MPLDTGILPHLKPVLKGALSWIPGVRRAFYDANAAGGTGDVQYCYGVWLKHLALLWGAGMQRIPTTVAELGPGRSLGTGLAALLCGAERYGAIDAVRHASAATTTPVLEPMSTLFRERAPRPRKGWPDVDEMLDARLFPSHILTDELLERSLAAPRLAELGHAVRQLDAKEQHTRLRYGTWRDAGHVVQDGEADLLFSQVVPSLVEDKETFYQCCARWLKPGGWMSHHIDFTSMGATNEWNGHLQYSEAVWKIIVGQRPFFVSRERLSSHVGLMQKYGFEIVSVARRTEEGGIDRSRLAPRWRDMSDDDLQCAHAFVIARKRG